MTNLTICKTKEAYLVILVPNEDLFPNWRIVKTITFEEWDNLETEDDLFRFIGHKGIYLGTPKVESRFDNIPTIKMISN